MGGMTRAAIALAGLLAGCGGASDGPVITSLAYRGQQPQKPLVLELEAQFTHSAGELGLGELHLSLDGAERSELPLDEVFRAQTPEVALDATAGAFRVQISLDPPVAEGREILIGLFVIDRLGVESNQPTITLRARPVSQGES
mgnify:CR=1 FL=1